MFLIGVWAGRRGVFHDPTRYTATLLRVLIAGLLIGLPGNLVLARTAELVPLRPPTTAGVALTVVRAIGVPALALAYAAAFTRLFQHTRFRAALRLFAPAGRTSLTNYVAQSLIGIFIGYGVGLGLWGRVGLTQTAAIIAIIFAAQSACSVAWLRQFPFGPLEHVLRRLTYGTRPTRARHAPPASSNPEVKQPAGAA